jgi:alkylation response protein AidB-like acyl-CoA dehydrogenase
MEFTWTPEQQDLRASTRRLLQSRASLARARELAEAGTRHDPAFWTAMAQQAGLQGIALAEEHGGSGGSWVELAIVFEEAGRVLLGGPFLSSVVLAAEALRASGDDAAQQRYLPPLADGELTATLAVAEADGRWAPASITARATGSGDDVRLTGEKELVLDGADADLVLVVARGERGPSLYAVDSAAPGLAAERLEVLDFTRPMAWLRMDDVPARLVGEEGTAWAVVEHVRRATSIMLAAEQVGAMSALVDVTAEHARTRRAFGRPIGIFQGVKHRLADMAVRLEMARSAAYWAAWQQPGSADLAMGAAVARSYCSEAFLQTAKDCIQLHGGTGFTWEHDAHLFLRRACADATLVGAPAQSRADLVPLVLPELAEVPA